MTSRPTGRVVWITGLAGAGKTTIATALHGMLQSGSSPDTWVRLDGDDIREIMGNDLGHGVEDRIANAWRICRLCRYLSEKGISVIVATMSLFKECQEWNRETLRRYFEVLVEVEHATLLARDQKGLYSGFLADTTANVAGMDQHVHFPESPDLVVTNDDGGDGPEAAASRIVAELAEASL